MKFINSLSAEQKYNLLKAVAIGGAIGGAIAHAELAYRYDKLAQKQKRTRRVVDILIENIDEEAFAKVQLDVEFLSIVGEL